MSPAAHPSLAVQTVPWNRLQRLPPVRCCRWAVGYLVGGEPGAPAVCNSRKRATHSSVRSSASLVTESPGRCKRSGRVARWSRGVRLVWVYAAL